MPAKILALLLVISLLGTIPFLPQVLSLALSNLGSIDVVHKRDNTAVEWNRLALKWNEGNASAYGNLAQIYTRQGRLEDAIGATKQAIRFAPHDRLLLFRLGNLLEQNGQRDEAGEAWLLAGAEPKFLAASDYSRLAAVYEAGMRIGGEFDKRASRAFLHLLLGAPEKSITMLVDVSGLAWHEEQLRQYELGVASIFKGDIDGGRASFLLAQKQFGKGNENRGLELPSACEAETIHNRILDSGKATLSSYRNLRLHVTGFERGLCLQVTDAYLGKRDLASARRELDVAFALRGHDPRLLYRLGQLELWSGNPLKAEEHLVSAFGVKPADLTKEELRGFCAALLEARRAASGRAEQTRPECT